MKETTERIFRLKYVKKSVSCFLSCAVLLFITAFPLYSSGNDLFHNGVETEGEAASAIQQQLTVTGEVTDEEGNPMPGVNIVEKGTMNGTISDTNGRYTLTVTSPDAVLVFSFVGYDSQEITVGSRRMIDVILVEAVSGIEEVVVVGYGTQRKSDITGSITSVDADRLRDAPASSITKALQGKTAGVEIVNLSRRPGGDTQIRIRGNRSLSASNDPLIVVDGIPFGGRLSDIATDDIASIEILKDASATVIYGSRGSNGVILITTRRGQPGTFKVAYNGYVGVNQVARKYEVYDAEGFVKLRSVANNNSYTTDEIFSLLNGRETDWQELLYRDGMVQNHELNLSGGTERTRYSFTGGYYQEEGILSEMGFNRTNMRLAIDQKIGEHVMIGFSTMNAYAVTDGQSANPMFQILAMSPLSMPYNLDGTVKEQPMYPMEDYYNPLTLRDTERWGERNRRATSFNTLYAEVDLFEGFKYRLNAGFNFSSNKYANYYGSNTVFRGGALNQARVDNSDNLGYTIENLLIYEKTFAEKHRINFTGMQSIQQDITTSSRVDATDVAADYIKYHNLALAETVEAPSANNYYSDWRLVSFMGRINYAFSDKYLLTITARADGSSRLAPGNKWHYYPAVAAGWNIRNESFMENVDFLSALKLRLGYGQTSNTSINPYSTLGGLSGAVYNFGDRGVKGYFVSNLPNENLSWEYTKTSNIGLDFGFLRGRITGSVDAYLQQTYDLLLGKSLPPSQGVPGQFLENVGETENRGIEIALDGIIISPSFTGGFRWDFSTNLFLNREKIVALQDPSIEKDVGNGWFVGYPSSAIYDYVKIGIWQLGEEAEAASYGREPGDIKLLDFAGGGPDGDEPDGRITDADRRVLGSSQPDFIGGFTSSWEYRGFDLSVVGYYRVGGMIASTLHMPNNYLNRLDGRRNQIVVDYWTPDNPTNDMPKPEEAFDASRSDVLGYFDGSFLKIRSINLGYTFSKEFTRFLGPSGSLRAYATVADPFILFSPYLKKGGVDPEPTNRAQDDIAALGLPGRTLVVGYNTPPTRRILFGLNVSF
ncbi:MAG TPA: TonB-dependent receptor [Bacteroidetes bacterium]|nr:TonB-dependent receptor [Bacteroidota bacterium]